MLDIVKATNDVAKYVELLKIIAKLSYSNIRPMISNIFYHFFHLVKNPRFFEKIDLAIAAETLHTKLFELNYYVTNPQYRNDFFIGDFSYVFNMLLHLLNCRFIVIFS